MAVKIQIKRGSKAGLPALAPGEYGLATDTAELFVGGSSGNLQIPVLDSAGKVPSSQLPEMDYDPAGSAEAVQTSLTAHVNDEDNPHGVTAAQVGAVPTSRTVNGKALSSDITLTAGDLGAGPGKRTARFTVGTSAAGWTSADCDYLCDGTDDQSEINAAIQALSSTGGEVVILDGTYNITAPIDMNKNNVKLSGNGNATVLKRMWGSTLQEGVIEITGASGGCCVENLCVDGNRASYNSINNCGIYLSSGDNNNTITGNTFNNNSGNGIYLSGSNNNTITGNTFNNSNNNSGNGIYLSGSNNNTITGNTFNNSNNNIGESCGIYLSSSDNNTIIGNTCYNGGYGICMKFGSNNNTITGNTCYNNGYDGIYIIGDNNTITGNTCYNGGYGIGTGGSDNNTITGNTCYNNVYGIGLNGINNTITGNTCIRGTGTAGDYTSFQHTIYLFATSRNNLIAYNNIMGKNYTDAGGTGNTFEGNKYN